MADTAVSIGCRKTIEVAGRLSAWLDRSDVLAAEVKPVIGTALERATLDLRRVMRSIDFPPCVGVVGGPDRNKLQLVASALFQEGSTTVSELSDLRNQQQGLAALLDHIAGEDLGAAVRFRSADARAPVGEGYRFPVQIELLSSLDVVKIIIAAYYSHYPDAVRTKLNQSDIESAIERADSELSTAAVSGFSPEDVSSLRQHLWTEYGASAAEARTRTEPSRPSPVDGLPKARVSRSIGATAFATWTSLGIGFPPPSPILP